MAKTAKKITKIERLFDLMKDGRNYRASTLNKAVGWRFGAYIFELRGLGCEIESYQAPDGEWRYQMLYAPYNMNRKAA